MKNYLIGQHKQAPIPDQGQKNQSKRRIIAKITDLLRQSKPMVSKKSRKRIIAKGIDLQRTKKLMALRGSQKGVLKDLVSGLCISSSWYFSWLDFTLII